MICLMLFTVTFQIDKSKTKLMFVYMNETMKEIALAHGEFVFLDSTHKTNRYNLPLFQLVVYTPHGFQVRISNSFGTVLD